MSAGLRSLANLAQINPKDKFLKRDTQGKKPVVALFDIQKQVRSSELQCSQALVGVSDISHRLWSTACRSTLSRHLSPLLLPSDPPFLSLEKTPTGVPREQHGQRERVGDPPPGVAVPGRDPGHGHHQGRHGAGGRGRRGPQRRVEDDFRRAAGDE